MHIFHTTVSVLLLFALSAKCAPAPRNVSTLATSQDDVVFEFDFEDKNYDKWWLDASSVDTDFFMDVQQSRWHSGIISPALRVGEITKVKDTEAKIGYKPKFQLEGGVRYQLAFSARSSLMGVGGAVVPALGSKFGPYVQAVVYNAKDTIYRVRPGKGHYYENEWYRWGFSFTVPESQAGDAYFAFIIEASGLGVDWWFDDISLIKV